MELDESDLRKSLDAEVFGPGKVQGGTFSLEGLDQASQIRYLWRENLNLKEMTSELKAELLEFRNIVKQIEGVAEDSSGEKSEPARVLDST